MGQHPSTHHEPLERGAAARRSSKRVKGDKGTSPRRMDRLRRSFRDSFRRRKEHVPESSKPHQWQADEAAVRAGTCSFHVKYLGCVEVFESRGMQVCEEALKVLRNSSPITAPSSCETGNKLQELNNKNSRRRPVKAILYVSGDGLRVVEDETKGLIVDQTIEKVSFCAPDRNHEKGFSYICRDGTTRRWMCHGFLALKESQGERLSHAVGCAFAACLERKQKRDKECGVTMTFDPKNSTFTRTGSFRQASLTERLQDPQELKPVDPPPVKPVVNPFAIERPHATVSMLQRQGSFRGFTQLNQASPFKRQMSLRISDLPSTLERQRSLSLEGSDFRLPPVHMMAPAVNGRTDSPQLGPRVQRNRLQSLPNAMAAYNMSPIPEASPMSDKIGDSVSAMCQQLSQGLSLLSSNDDFLPELSSKSGTGVSSSAVAKQLFPAINSSVTVSNSSTVSGGVNLEPLKYHNNINSNNNNNNTSSNSSIGSSSGIQWTGTGPHVSPPPAVSWGSPVLPPRATPTPPPATMGYCSPANSVTPVPVSSELPRPEQWLGSVVNSTVGPSPSPSPSPRRAPHLAQHLRAHSLGSAEPFMRSNGQPPGQHDPFDAEWAAIAARNHQQAVAKSTNPFITPSSIKAFEVHM